MTCSGVSYRGVGNFVSFDRNMNAEGPVNILHHNLLASAERIGIRAQYMFQVDNDLQHSVTKSQEWLIFNVPRQLHTPPLSTDINMMAQCCLKYNITGIRHLRQCLFQEWIKIDVELQIRYNRNINLKNCLRLNFNFDTSTFFQDIYICLYLY